jgi:hypothetical protein
MKYHALILNGIDVPLIIEICMASMSVLLTGYYDIKNHRIQRRSQAGQHSTSYSEGMGFKSWPKKKMAMVRLFVVFPIPFRQIP